jgi:hypothetical protein
MLDDHRLSKRNMCDGKRSHHTYNGARKEIDAIPKSKQENIYPYTCFYCGKLHVGHIIKESM